MITFKTFLEQEQETLKAFAHRLCSPFFKESNGAGLLYRGMNIERHTPGFKVENLKTFTVDGTEFECWRVKAQTNRAPLSTNRHNHRLVDRWFDDAFGFKARSNSVFCYGNPGKTVPYGRRGVMLPIGSMQYVWSPVVEDLYLHLVDNRLTDDEETAAFMKPFRYKDADLDQAIRSDCEIMVHCDEYIFIDVWSMSDSNGKISKIKKELGVN